MLHLLGIDTFGWAKGFKSCVVMSDSCIKEHEEG